MAKVEQTVKLNAPADSVWEVIGNFSDLGWYPGNKGTQTETVDGKLQRIVPLPGGAELREQEEGDSGSHSYSYTLASGPIPVTDYRCSLRVEPDGDGANRC
ncbi:MAG: SRPBCC family protein, partial [Fimbriimonadaceae bacterium]|nr:SRPBCC family protein [Alphaproteobacteria bacterium]